jgi:6-phosphofructo-2-kinase/fructose-2,6-biphosphatase 4
VSNKQRLICNTISVYRVFGINQPAVRVTSEPHQALRASSLAGYRTHVNERTKEATSLLIAGRLNALKSSTMDTLLYVIPEISIFRPSVLIQSSTADLAARSTNFRRRSSTYVDAIHDLPEKASMAPAQLYSTESGRLFHSGRIVIATVGLPARGKTHVSVALARYLRWLGVKTHIFHLGDYRRAHMGPKGEIPDDYFFVNASTSSVLLRNKILKKCREDILHFLNHENGQIAIFDAVNPLSTGRYALAKEFEKQNIQTLFIESTCTDERIIEENVRSVKISSPDYIGWSSEDAVKDYLHRINSRIPHYETVEEKDLHYVKMINAGERMIVNNCAFGYLSQRIVFYLLNLHIKSRQTYFCRAGTTKEEDSYKADASLSEEGEDYARKMTETLIKHRETERQNLIKNGAPESTASKPLSVWTSTRRRTIETSQYLGEAGYPVRQRSQMSQLNPGVCEKMSERKIREQYPEEVTKHELDPYHHRYPRAEVSTTSPPHVLSYHANKISPITTLPSASSQSSWNLNASRTTS